MSVLHRCRHQGHWLAEEWKQRLVRRRRPIPVQQRRCALVATRFVMRGWSGAIPGRRDHDSLIFSGAVSLVAASRLAAHDLIHRSSVRVRVRALCLGAYRESNHNERANYFRVHASRLPGLPSVRIAPFTHTQHATPPRRFSLLPVNRIADNVRRQTGRDTLILQQG